MSDGPDVRIVDVTDIGTFERLPPCVDPRFDHRSCDYWEDDVRGSKALRPTWWQERPRPASSLTRPPDPDNPFSAPAQEQGFNPFAPTEMTLALEPIAGDDLVGTPVYNPFAPTLKPDGGDAAMSGPRKLRLLSRGRDVFGSYAKVLLLEAKPAVYAQFGPLSAYPRAQRIRDLYPQLPQSPLPAVITCVATVGAERGRGLGRRLVEAICEDLGERGFAAVEAYPDLTLGPDAASAAHPGFWLACGFGTTLDDERYPVMRRDLD